MPHKFCVKQIVELSPQLFHFPTIGEVQRTFVDSWVLYEQPVDLTGKVVCRLYDIHQILDDAHKVIHTVGANRLLDKRHNAHKKKKAYPKRADLAGSGVSMLLQKYKDFFFMQNILLENCHLEGYF